MIKACKSATDSDVLSRDPAEYAYEANESHNDNYF